MDRSIAYYGRVLFYCKVMRKILYILILVSLSVSGYSQTARELEIIEIVSRSTARMKSLECDFVQTKHISMLNDKMVSKGKMYYQQPDRLRWEYVTPYSYTFILNASQVMLKNSGRTDVIDVNRNRMFKEIARIMMDSILGRCLTDEKSFRTEITENEREWVATLYPQKKDMKQMWNRLVIHFDRSSEAVVKVEMHEPGGDHTVIDLKNININKTLDQQVFTIE